MSSSLPLAHAAAHTPSVRLSPAERERLAVEIARWLARRVS